MRAPARPTETDWARIAALYDALAQLTPSPVVELNRAVAVAMAFGPAAGLELVDALTSEPSLRPGHRHGGWAPTHGASPSVRTLAARIINAQQDEIVTMQRWLGDRGQPVPEAHAAGDEDVMVPSTTC